MSCVCASFSSADHGVKATVKLFLVILYIHGSSADIFHEKQNRLNSKPLVPSDCVCVYDNVFVCVSVYVSFLLADHRGGSSKCEWSPVSYDLYTHTFIYIGIYMYLYTFVYTYTYIYIYTHIYTHFHVCIYIIRIYI